LSKNAYQRKGGWRFRVLLTLPPDVMLDQETLRVILVVIISYLLGSLPTAYIIGRFKNVDIFSVGSGNMGATNVIRSVGFGWGMSVVLFDSIKGIAAILLAQKIMYHNHAAAITIAAIVSIIGHNWSLFATLLTATIHNGKVRATIRGGKGAATAFGTLLMIAPLQVIAVMLLVGGLIVAVTRYVSLGVLSMFGIALLWIAILTIQQEMEQEFLYYSMMIAALIAVRFRGNIQRLLEGRERRLGEPA
jgi:acyl phosphate:glycerol-3-phosphate acyltransferase